MTHVHVTFYRRVLQERQLRLMKLPTGSYYYNVWLQLLNSHYYKYLFNAFNISMVTSTERAIVIG